METKKKKAYKAILAFDKVDFKIKQNVKQGHRH